MLCRASWGVLRGGLRSAGRRTPVPVAVLQARQMSFGIPTSGLNLTFMVLGGGSLTAALVYAYKTVHSDSVRYSSRITDIEARLKTGDPASVAEVTTLQPVAEANAVETPSQVALEYPDPGPATSVAVAVAEEAITEVTVAAATKPALEDKDTTEATVATAMDTASEEAEVAVEAEPALSVITEAVIVETTGPVTEAVVVPVLEVLDAVKVLSGSIVEMAAASVGDERSSSLLVPPSGQADEQMMVLPKEIKASEDVAASTEETGGPETPCCQQSATSCSEHTEPEVSIKHPTGLENMLHIEHADPEASTAAPTGLEDPPHADVEPEVSIMPSTGLDNILHVEHVEHEAPTTPHTGLEVTSHAGHVDPESSITPPTGLEEILQLEHAQPEAPTAQDDITADSTAAMESEEEDGDEEADEKSMTATKVI